MKRSDRNYLITAGVLLLFLVVHSVLRDDPRWWDAFKAPIHTDVGAFLGVFFLMLVGLTWSFMGEARARSPKLFLENADFNWNPHKDFIRSAGGNDIITVGGILAMGISTRGRLACVIVPADAHGSWGIHHQCLAYGRWVDRSKLPIEVQKELDARPDLPQRYFHADLPAHVERRRRDLVEKLLENDVSREYARWQQDHAVTTIRNISVASLMAQQQMNGNRLKRAWNVITNKGGGSEDEDDMGGT